MGKKPLERFKPAKPNQSNGFDSVFAPKKYRTEHNQTKPQ